MKFVIDGKRCIHVENQRICGHMKANTSNCFSQIGVHDVS